jgi:hypothetical protein
MKLSKKLFILFLLVLQVAEVRAQQFTYLDHVDLPTKEKFQSSKLGGLSGLVQDPTEKEIYWAVSDDRGAKGEPRFYKFRIQYKAKKLLVEPLEVIWLKWDQSPLSHEKKIVSAHKFSEIFDLEAVAFLPWGDFLFSSEGDLNHRPRVNPTLFSVNKEGVIQKKYEIPEEYLSEISGQQKKGLENNHAFEGMAMSPDQKSLWVAAEGPLLQEKTSQNVRLLEYNFPDAWVLKPSRSLLYPLKPEEGELERGISEIIFLDSSQLLVLERAASLGSGGVQFSVQIFKVDMKVPASSSNLQKTKIFDFKSLEKSIGPLSNFEAIAWGPVLEKGQKTLIFLSDDNFKKSQKTQFVLVEFKD